MSRGHNDPVNIAQRIEDDGRAGLLVYSIVAHAKELFSIAGCPDDFCLQLANGEVIVFGGTNRLKWHAARGFYPDSSYCTPTFLEAMKKEGLS